MHDRYSKGTYPLSSMQQGMLFHTVSDPSSGVYVQQKILRLSEVLNIDALDEAWQRVVERHSILRTRFHLDAPQGPVQVVCPHFKVTLEQEDCRSLTEAEQQHRMEAFLLADRRRGFDFEAGPPFRLILFRHGDAVYELVWTSHHALLDGRSYVLVLTELFQIYEALCAGQHLQLQEPRPYGEFVDWLSKQDWNEAEGYWRKTLKGIAAPTPLVVDTARSPGRKTRRFRKQDLTLSESTTTRLHIVAEANDFTINNVVQGAWAVLLSRYSSEQEVLFGTTRAGRSAVPAGRDRVGLFINTVPFRVNVAPETSVVEFLEELRRQHVALREYEQTPLSMIQPWSEIPRPLPLFESVLIFEHSVINRALRSHGVGWEHREFRLEERTHYPLTVGAYLDECLILKIGYDTRRFDDAAISRMLGHLQTLIEGMIADLGAPLREVPLLTERERHQVLREWNQTETDFPKDSTLHGLFQDQVDRTPDDAAVIFQGSQLTYRELNQRANQLARHLRELGAAKQVVGICMERSLEIVVGLLGILKADAAYLPIDPSYPKERLAFMLSDAQVPVLVTQERLLAGLPRYGAETVCLDTEGFLAESARSSDNVPHRTTPEALAYVIYTSGSTGQPKGTMIPHRAICNHMHWMQAAFPLLQDDRVLQKTPISFDASVWEFFAPLFSGATLVMARPGGHQESAYLIRTVIEQKITILQVVPSMLELLLEEPEFPGAKSLKRVFCGGEALSHDVVRRFVALLDAELINLYGPTEASIDATYWRCTGQEEAVPIGRPIANMQAYVLDAGQQPVPVGVPGQLYLSGAGLARGYLDRPSLTAEKFVRHPFSNDSAARMYMTGDRGAWESDGTLSFLGRTDSQVKFRGFRIELGEIETLLNDRQDVSQAVVIVREDVPGDKRLVAYLVPQDNTALDVEGLRRTLLDHLPRYMVPTAYVTLKALPLTPNGKIDRKALPSPVASQSEMDREVIAARDEFESELVHIWEDLLDKRPISIYDNFFDLGGDSLLAMRLLIHIKKRFSQQFSEMSIFQAPTVATLASVVRGSQGPTESSVVVPIKVNGDRPPFFLAGLAAGRLVRNLADHLDSDRPLYAILTKKLGDEAYYGDTVPTAMRLIEEIKSVQPEGPYHLGSFCNQGPVVLEMAQQLLARGEQVGLLAMIESLAPGRRSLSYRIRRIIYRDYHRAKTHFQTIKQLPLTEKLTYFLESGNSLLKRIMRRISRGAQRLLYHAYRWSARPVPQELRSSKAVSATLYRRYVPKDYRGRIWVFVGHMAQFLHDRTLGWNEIASGGVEVHISSGSHTDMLREPHVRDLGRCLDACLERAEAELTAAIGSDTNRDAVQLPARSSQLESGKTPH